MKCLNRHSQLLQSRPHWVGRSQKCSQGPQWGLMRPMRNGRTSRYHGLSTRSSTASRQLVACCSSELATCLSRVTGGKHFTLEETTLLLQMKELAVKYQNPAVNVQEFLAMSQQPDEESTIRKKQEMMSFHMQAEHTPEPIAMISH